MTPYSLSLKHWLFKTLPSLKSRDLFEHEALLTRGFAQSIEYQQQIFPVFNTESGTADPLGNYKTRLAANIRASIAKSDDLVDKQELQHIKKFWMKQKVYASMQRDFQQVIFKPSLLLKKTVASAQFYFAYWRILLQMTHRYLNKIVGK